MTDTSKLHANLAIPSTSSLRTAQRRLLALLEVTGPLTRSELANLARLPLTTVAGAIGELLGQRLVLERESGPRSHQAGRPPRTLEATGPPRVVAMVARRDSDLHLTVVTLTGELVADRTEALSGSGPVKQHFHDPEPVLPAAGRLVLGTLNETGIRPARLAGVVVSVARPRPQDTDITPLQAQLEAPVVAENDANLGALGEATFGAGRGLDSFVYVMLGHGIGAGMVFGGRLHRGAAGFAGELAHVQVREQEGGPACACGGRGCLAMVMGPSLHEFVSRAWAQRLSVPEVLSLAADREPGVRRVFADLGRTVGRPLADLCTMLDPAAVVVDGSFGAAGEPVMAGIREAIDRHSAPAVADSVRVLPGELGDRAEILGAAALVRQRTLDET